jgi:pyridinium-3,5-biscarboxylic acid mononucleotide sulfurtransferase
MPEDDATVKEQQLRALLSESERCLVAFSAGVDSTYLLAIAFEVLGGRCEAVTADSPSLARSSLEEATRFCQERGITHHVVATAEFEQPEYRANDGRRCYHCKAALFTAMNALAAATAAERGNAALLLGAIAEDFGDIRPGLQAAAEAGAQWPLASAGFSKDDVRRRSKAIGLSTWDRPAEPCLASRVPYGETVTPEAMRQIDDAEAVLHWLGLRECRARHHTIGQGRGLLCRIEVPDSDLQRVLDVRSQLVPAIKRLGYQQVALDLVGLVSGGLNTLLSDDERNVARATPALIQPQPTVIANP